MTTYSFSQVSTYLQCPRKYQFSYLDRLKVKEFETSYELLLGSLIHQTLERWYQQIFPQDSFLFPPKVPTFSETLDYYTHHREKLLRESGVIRETADYLPEDIYHRGEQYLRNYLSQHADFSSFSSLETEKMMLFTLPNGQSFKGIIDRLDILKDGTLIINDYKTGKKLPTASDTSYINQLSLYAYALRQQYGAETTIKARLYYLHFGLQDEWEIQDDFLNALVAEYESYTSEIELTRTSYLQTKTLLPTKENAFCSYCEYQSSCPLWKWSYNSDFSADEQVVLPLIDEYSSLTKQIGTHKKQLEYHKNLLIDYMHSQQLSSFVSGDIILKLSKRTGIDFPDIPRLEAFLHEHLLREQGSSVTRFKVASLIREGKLDPKDCRDILENNPYPSLTPANNKRKPTEE